VELERARMVHMSTGFTNAYADKSSLHGIAYVSFQELATRVSHRNTGKISGDPTCELLLAKVAADENLHMIFYRNLLAAAFELAPNDAMRAVTDVVMSFQMPGHGIENFARKSVQIAMAGVYDLRIHHDEVVIPVLRNVRALETEGLSGDGAKARDELVASLAELDRMASRFVERRETINARKASSAAHAS
jgi:acyl-[acyl-carrier-protein] desaturase